MSVLWRVFAGLVIAALVAVGVPGSASAAPGRVSVGYFMSSDMYDGYYPKDIPTADYTHINYAFAKPTSTGKCALWDPNADYRAKVSGGNSVTGVADTNSQKLRGNFNQLKELKADHPGLKVLITIGGWTLSRYFSDIAATAAKRTAFVKSCVAMFIKGNLPVSGSQGGVGVAKGIFDGIDIDWEFPVGGGLDTNHHRAADRVNATALFKEFRKQLNAYGKGTGKHYLLTAAMPAGNVGNAHYELAKVGATLDWLNVMLYDIHGPWDATTDFDSPFKFDSADPAGSSAFTVQGTINYMLGNGVPASKLVIGVPFYGYQYTGVQESASGDGHFGLYRPFNQNGVTNPTFREIVGLDNTPGYSEHSSSAAGEPWLWSASAAGGTFVTYEDAASIGQRVSYVKAKGLRGLMVWEISQDDDGHTLGTALGQVLH